MPARNPSVYFNGYGGGRNYLGGATGPQPGASEQNAPIAFGSVRYGGGSGGSSHAQYEQRPRKKIGAIDPYDRLTGRYIPGYGMKADPPKGLFSVGPRGQIEDPWARDGVGPKPAMTPTGVDPTTGLPNTTISPEATAAPSTGFDPRLGFTSAPTFRTAPERQQREIDVFGVPGATGREIAYNGSKFNQPGVTVAVDDSPKVPSEIPGYYWQGGELKPIDPAAEGHRIAQERISPY